MSNGIEQGLQRAVAMGRVSGYGSVMVMFLVAVLVGIVKRFMAAV
jgi:hypothetical protein